VKLLRIRGPLEKPGNKMSLPKLKTLWSGVFIGGGGRVSLYREKTET